MTTEERAALTPFDALDRKRILGIDSGTLDTMRKATPLLERSVDRIVEGFYERVTQIPALTRLVGEHSTLDRLSNTLRQYILDFTTTRLDDAHVAQRVKIAEIHDRIGLPIDAYVAQLSAIREEWSRIVWTDQAKSKRSVDECLEFVTALDKLLAFDEGIVSRYFTDALADALGGLEAQRGEERLRQQQELDAVAGQLAATADEASAAVEELAATADAVAQSVTNAAHQAQTAASAGDDGREALKATQDTVRRVGEATEHLESAAGSLEISSRRIEDVSVVLTQTADRINLLALNAAIEAARAGEAGRGFAVVADEVRKLAEATQVHLVESGAAVSEMRQSIALVRSAGESTSSQVADLTTAADVMGERFDRIATATDQTSQTLADIAAASEQVAAATAETGRTTSQVSDLAKGLAKMSEDLRA